MCHCEIPAAPPHSRAGFVFCQRRHRSLMPVTAQLIAKLRRHTRDVSPRTRRRLFAGPLEVQSGVTLTGPDVWRA